jgi:hypothetical protein
LESDSSGFVLSSKERFMPHAVGRPVGLVEFESSLGEMASTCVEEYGESTLALTLREMRATTGTAADAGANSPRPAAPAAKVGDLSEIVDVSEIVDADLEQLTDELYALVAHLVGEICGVSRQRRAR